MKVARHKTFVLLICALNFSQVFCVVDNSHHGRGERCNLDSNQSGICTEAKYCDYAMKLVRERKNTLISRCQFEGRIPIVCCPSSDQPPITTPAPVTTTRTVPVTTTRTALTTPATHTNLQYPKSKKFLSALCKNNETKTHIFEQNIIGGESAGVGEFPFQVAIGYLKQEDNTTEYRCGGSLIADDIVLTAAHCANRKDTTPITVKLGRASLVADEYDYGDGEDIEIQSIKLHPKYSRFSRHNDIAIIKLKQPTKFSWPIETICLSSDDENMPKNFTITGYGRNDVDTRKTSDWLLRATVNLHPFQQCKDFIKKGGKDLIETQICAIGYKGADACQGDSGGPLSYTITGIPYLYGVISFGSACGGSSPGVYTKVNQYLEWIDDNMYAFEQN